MKQILFNKRPFRNWWLVLILSFSFVLSRQSFMTCQISTLKSQSVERSQIISSVEHFENILLPVSNEVQQVSLAVHASD